ncbi:MAG TPA: methyltransferase domain-containing protein [Chitinophagales bacterium]|nr:methyltransferase domain-containing protein [Chitinophagales bacterium]
MQTAHSSFAQLEHDGWERVANQYESVWSSLTKKYIEPLLNSIGEIKGMKLLDVACGPGYVSDAALHKGAHPTGIDFSKEMISIAKKKYPEVEFIVGDAQSLPFTIESFDCVAMNFGLLHLPDPDQALREANRVLKNEGRFGFTVWAPPEISDGSRMMRNAIEKFGNMNVDLPESPPYFRFCDEDEAGMALVAAGFDESSVKFETRTVHWQVPTDTFLFDAELNAGVRTAALLARQDSVQLEAIRHDVKLSMEKYRVKSGYDVPYSAHIITAAKK